MQGGNGLPAPGRVEPRGFAGSVRTRPDRAVGRFALFFFEFVTASRGSRDPLGPHVMTEACLSGFLRYELSVRVAGELGLGRVIGSNATMERVRWIEGSEGRTGSAKVGARVGACFSDDEAGR